MKGHEKFINSLFSIGKERLLSSVNNLLKISKGYSPYSVTYGAGRWSRCSGTKSTGNRLLAKGGLASARRKAKPSNIILLNNHAGMQTRPNSLFLGASVIFSLQLQPSFLSFLSSLSFLSFSLTFPLFLFAPFFPSLVSFPELLLWILRGPSP